MLHEVLSTVGLRFLFLFGFEADAAEEEELDEEEEEDDEDDEEPDSSRAFRARRETYSSRMRAQPLEMVAGALALPLLLIVRRVASYHVRVKSVAASTRVESGGHGTTLRCVERCVNVALYWYLAPALIVEYPIS